MGHPVVLRVLTKAGDYLIAVGVDALLLLGPRVHPLLAALQREVATKVLEKYIFICKLYRNNRFCYTINHTYHQVYYCHTYW